MRRLAHATSTHSSDGDDDAHTDRCKKESGGKRDVRHGLILSLIGTRSPLTAALADLLYHSSHLTTPRSCACLHSSHSPEPAFMSFWNKH